VPPTLLPDIVAPIAFAGVLASEQASVPVEFTAHVDGRGELVLGFNDLEVTRENADLLHDSPGGNRVRHLNLWAVGADGEGLTSASFYLTSTSHSSGPEESAFGLKGRCQQADLVLRMKAAADRPSLIWGVRRFEALHAPTLETPLGAASVAGKRIEEDGQAISGWLAVQAADRASTDWWTEAERLLAHLARVMSLASGTFLRPYVERYTEGQEFRLRLSHRVDTAPPFLPPFQHFLLENIVMAAGASFEPEGQRLARLEPVLHWLLAPASYDEQRFLFAMTALESLVEHEAPSRELLTGGAWARIRRAVRGMLVECGAPQVMIDKIPELNRPSFRQRLADYIRTYAIPVHDIQPAAISALLPARNAVVHRGIYHDEGQPEQSDIWDHIVAAREIVLRRLFQIIGFRGQYFSPLHNNEMIGFPECGPSVQEEPPADGAEVR
jgi:hypothetical protein